MTLIGEPMSRLEGLLEAGTALGDAGLTSGQM
jgi:hypothetical protein